ncbi:hypothetical protein A5761_00690 [Mycolicibacterium setense]|nr:hypothetical protein A5761_00690 [Mycolicibacterium setense]
MSKDTQTFLSCFGITTPVRPRGFRRTATTWSRHWITHNLRSHNQVVGRIPLHPACSWANEPIGGPQDTTAVVE